MLVLIALLFVGMSALQFWFCKSILDYGDRNLQKFALSSQMSAIGIGNAILYTTVKIHENKWLPFTSATSRDFTGYESPQIFGFLDW